MDGQGGGAVDPALLADIVHGQPVGIDAVGKALHEAVLAGLGIDIAGMVHHSDRGIQYTSQAYVKMLLSVKAQISMTQTGDPLHNAMAERMNNTVKNSWLFNNGELDFASAGGSISNAIYMYNHARPHQALDMKTPYEMMTGHSDNPLLKAAIGQEGKGEGGTIEQDV